WRALAGAAGALAAALAAALVFVVVSRPTGPHQYVAVLQKSADAPAFAMTVDLDRLEFSVRPVAAQAPAGKSYELWMIAPNSATPQSLGVIRAGERRLAADKAKVRDATYAVTLEPEGGSPTGRPTSAPLFFGKLVPVGP
ncbi:MAG: anti-sigma factor, partial [Pseudomonadota bacterium]|nr:anti-sigma factor [Pseudomonadota bacterium]